MTTLYYQKVFIWCLVQTASSICISYIWTKHLNTALYIAMNEFVVVISLYSLYEYYWDLWFKPHSDVCCQETL